MTCADPFRISIAFAISVAAAGCSPPPVASSVPPSATVTASEEPRPPAPEPTAQASAPPPVAVPTLPRPWPGDEHATVLSELSSSCSVLGVQDGSVFITSSDKTSHNLYRVPLAGGAPLLVHTTSTTPVGTYRVGHGRLVIFRHLGHSLGTLHLIAPGDGKETLLEDGARPGSWTIGPNGVYWGDISYTEPEIFEVPFGGGERRSVEKLRPVFNEDRIEDLIESDGELYFVAERTQLDAGRGRSCDEVRGGPAGGSRSLRRWSGKECSKEDMVSSLSVSPRHVYYWRDRAFRRVPKHGGKEEMVFEGDGLPQASWSDDRVLVWIDSRGLMRQSIEPKAKPEIVGERAWVLQGLTVTADRIYWARLEPKGPCLVLSRPLDAPAIQRSSVVDR